MELPMRRVAGLAALLSCLAMLPAQAQVHLLTAETILTGDKGQPTANAMAFDADSGRVLAVGNADALAARYAGAVRIDAGAVTVIPGLIDAHAHIVSLGNTLAQANLWEARSIDEVVARLRAFEAGLQPQQWLLGRGWDQNLWAGKAFPGLAELDAAFPDRPVYLDRVDGHAGWVNSAALRIAEQKLGRSLSGDWQPEGGRIERDAAGNPTGVLIDGAASLVTDHIPPLDQAERERRFERAQREAVANGLTGVHDMGTSRADLALLRQFADAQRLLLRIDAYADGDSDALDDLCRDGLYRHPGGRLKMTGVKLFMDGALGSRGAAMLAPYSDDAHNHGLLMMSPEQHAAAVRKAAGCNAQVATHAIGDRGNRIVLDNYQAVLAEHPGADLRWRVEHAQVVALEDIARFAPLGVIASMQPTHATSDMGWAQDRVGPQRILGAYAWQRYLTSGAWLALGSDFPVEQVDPRLGLRAAVTRQDADAQPAQGWYADQRLTAAQALDGFTADAARAGFDELEVGQLKAGLRADFVIVDRNPLTVAGQQLGELKVLSTWVDGAPVFESGTEGGK
jgi:predicted amidohydrolase YtcJ